MYQVSHSKQYFYTPINKSNAYICLSQKWRFHFFFIADIPNQINNSYLTTVGRNPLHFFRFNFIKYFSFRGGHIHWFQGPPYSFEIVRIIPQQSYSISKQIHNGWSEKTNNSGISTMYIFPLNPLLRLLL